MFAIKNLSTSDLEIIRKHLVEISTDKNEVIFEAGKTGDSMYFVETGSLKIVNRKSKDGVDDQIIGVIKPGGFFGEEVILSEGGFYSHTVVALEPSLLYQLNAASFQKIMIESTLAGTKLVLGISKSYREAISLTEQMGKIISFVSSKDGIGKTTVCMNLAEMMSRNNKKVLVIDCDFQLGNSHMHVGSPANPNIVRLIQMEERLTYDRISKFLIKNGGYHLLAAPELPQDSELITRSHMNQIIQECGKNYDFIFLDVGSHIDEISVLLWDLSDQIIIVESPNLQELTRFKRLMAVINRLNYPKEKLLGVLNKFSPGSEVYLEQFKAILPVPWMKISHDQKNVEEAVYNGKSVKETAGTSPVVKEIAEIYNRLTAEKTAEIKEKTGVFSWLKDFFSNN